MQSDSDIGKIKNGSWRINVPAQLLFLGPTQSGKSHTLLELIKNLDRVFDTRINQIIYASPTALRGDAGYVKQFVTIAKSVKKEVYILEKLPSVEEVREIYPQHPVLLIVDDLTSMKDLTGLSELSSFYCHHANISLIFSLQNPFQKTNKCDLTTLQRNITGRFLFYQSNDWRLNYLLNTILFPERKKFTVDCLIKAKKEKLNYIFINTHPQSELPRKYMCYSALFKEKNNELPLFFELTPDGRR